MKFKGIQIKLFISYIALTLSIAVVLGIVFYVYVSSLIENRVLSTYKQLVTSASSQLDQIVSDSDVLAKDVLVNRVLYSKNMLNYKELLPDYVLYLYDYFFFDSSNAPDIIRKGYQFNQSDTITSLLNSVNGLNYRAREILLYDTADRMYSAPFSVAPEAFKKHFDSNLQTEWFQNLLQKEGNSYLQQPYLTDWFNNKSSYVFSYYKSFRNNKEPREFAVIEIQQDFSKIEKIMNNSFGTNASQVMIYDKEGQQIYPIPKIEHQQMLIQYKQILDPLTSEEAVIHDWFNPNEKRQKALIAVRSLTTAWTVVLPIEYKMLYNDSYHFRNKFILIIGLILIYGLILSYFISKSITKPLKLMYSAVRKKGIGFGINALSLKQEQQILSSTVEVSQVYTAFKDTYEKLEVSARDTIEARSKEAEAHWLALQSQINPHFIYNTLSVIAAVSDEGNIEKTSFMCRKLSDMLSYVSIPENVQSTLENELEYSLDYLSLMKMRFENSLSYRVDIPDEMLQMEIPKLILQPIVENCINHGFSKSKPPWQIHITGHVTNEYWELNISDNGCGISADKLEAIHNQIVHGYTSTDGSQTESRKGGIGLIGSITRLNLRYKEQFNFNLQNDPQGGLKVTLRFTLQH